MNFRISRALPPGDLRSRRWTLPDRATYLTRRAGDACVLGVVERAGNTLYLAWGVRSGRRV